MARKSKHAPTAYGEVCPYLETIKEGAREGDEARVDIMWKAFKITFGAVLGVIFAYIFVILAGGFIIGAFLYHDAPPKHAVYRNY